MTDPHTCSYYCDRPECIKAQRDELRAKYVKLADAHSLALSQNHNDFKERLAQAIEQMPFGKDTIQSFAIFVRDFK